MGTIEKVFAVVKGLKFTSVGGSKSIPRLRGKCNLKKKGSIKIGKNFSAYGKPIPINIVTENSNSELIIGDNVFINYGVDIACSLSIKIADNVKIGPLTNIIDNNYHAIDSNDLLESNKIVIENNVWIGRGSIILPGVTIGENAVVAAGSVVTKDVMKNTLVGGVPAKEIRKLNIENGWIRK